MQHSLPTGTTYLSCHRLRCLIHLGALSWKDEEGVWLGNRPSLFIKAATNVLTYKEAGLFRINYNKPLPPIQGVKFEIKLKPGEEARPVHAGNPRYSPEETKEIVRQI
jgi:hypothetical protein